MKVNELTKQQLYELKCNHIVKTNDSKGITTSYSELMSDDDIITDETILGEYKGIEFTEEDFLS